METSELVELRERLLQLDARIHERPVGIYHYTANLNWARQMFAPGPPSLDSEHRIEAQRLIEESTGVILSEGLALLNEHHAVSQHYENALRAWFHEHSNGLDYLSAAESYARRYVMLPEEAIAYVRTLSETARNEWFFGRWHAPAIGPLGPLGQ